MSRNRTLQRGLIGVEIGAAIVFLVLTVRARAAMPHPPTGDMRVAARIQGTTFAGWDHFMRACRFLIETGTFGVVVCVALLVSLIWTQSWRGPFAVLVLAILTAVIGRGAKLSLKISSPVNVFAAYNPPDTSSAWLPSARRLLTTTLSFPSGHAFASAFLYSSFALLFIHAVRPVRWVVWAIGACVGAIIVATGAVLIYYSFHWPSEVLGGWLLALCVQIALWAWIIPSWPGFRQRLQSRRQGRKPDLSVT